MKIVVGDNVTWRKSEASFLFSPLTISRYTHADVHLLCGRVEAIEIQSHEMPELTRAITEEEWRGFWISCCNCNAFRQSEFVLKEDFKAFLLTNSPRPGGLARPIGNQRRNFCAYRRQKSRCKRYEKLLPLLCAQYDFRQCGGLIIAVVSAARMLCRVERDERAFWITTVHQEEK